MNRGLTGTQLCARRQLVKITTLVAGIVGLLAFYPLVGCASFQSASGSSTTAQASPWKLVWNDEFNGAAGTVSDPNKWTPDVGSHGRGMQELDYDTENQNAYQDGQGNLVLEARKANSERFQCWYGPCRYTAARIDTHNHFSYTYGLLVARIKLPSGQGLWSGFWLIGSNFATVGWPASGEIDVMENYGKKEPATMNGTVHGPGTSSDSHTLFVSSYTLPHGNFADDYHVFALQWDPSHLYFFVDGINYATFAKATLTNQQDWVFNHPFYIILDVAVGGWSGSPNSVTVFPQKMYVSYVRVYSHE